MDKKALPAYDCIQDPEALKIVQQKLDLFPARPFEDILVENNISGLSISFNSRLRKTWRCTIKHDKKRYLELPVILKNAPEDIKRSIIEWALLSKPRLRKNRPAYYVKKKKLEQVVWRYLAKMGISTNEKKVVNPKRFEQNTKGTIYDLQMIFDEINTSYFNGKIESYLRWASYASRISYQKNCFDENNRRFNLITIAGIYDHPDVPEYAIKSVMFHEMLHIIIRPYKKNGRNIIHGAEFRKTERAFPYYKKWHKWGKSNMQKIIRKMKRKRR